MSVQRHSRPLQLLLLFVSRIFLSVCVPCFCCLFLPFPVFAWVATQALGSKCLVHENYMCDLSRVQCPYLQTVHPILGGNLNGEATAVKNRHSTQVSCQQLAPSFYVFCPFYSVSHSHVLLLVSNSPSNHALFLYFYYVFSMSLRLYFPILEQQPQIHIY